MAKVDIDQKHVIPDSHLVNRRPKVLAFVNVMLQHPTIFQSLCVSHLHETTGEAGSVAGNHFPFVSAVQNIIA